MTVFGQRQLTFAEFISSVIWFWRKEKSPLLIQVRERPPAHRPRPWVSRLTDSGLMGNLLAWVWILGEALCFCCVLTRPNEDEADVRTSNVPCECVPPLISGLLGPLVMTSLEQSCTNWGLMPEWCKQGCNFPDLAWKRENSFSCGLF